MKRNAAADVPNHEVILKEEESLERSHPITPLKFKEIFSNCKIFFPTRNEDVIKTFLDGVFHVLITSNLV